MKDPQTGKFIKGFRASPETEFKKGHDTYRHPAGFRASPETEFQPGHTPQNFKGIGTPRVNKHNDKLELNTTTEEVVTATARGRTYKSKKRTTYARYLWELYVAKIPQGMIVYSNAGEGVIPTINDLELITRAELIKRNRGL